MCYTYKEWGGQAVMPHRYSAPTAKPSHVRINDPTLYMLRTLSKTTTSGVFSCSLNSSVLTRPSSSMHNFFIFDGLRFQMQK